MPKQRKITSGHDIKGEAVAALKKLANDPKCPYPYRAYCVAVLAKYAELTALDPALPGTKQRPNLVNDPTTVEPPVPEVEDETLIKMMEQAKKI